ncbi:hypothetical protein [Mesorhizobium sp. M0488]|uniref:hypothetical protein n=1 Tax=Mesorhizobium sp. M0488 TaxID=2956949 RepID=UPI0033364FFB
MGDHRAKHEESTDGTDQYHLADGEAGDQPLAHRVVQRKQEVAGQHQQNAGQEHVPDSRIPCLGLRHANPDPSLA